MTPFIGFLIGGALVLVIGVIWLEICEDREKTRRRAESYAEYEAWKRAREVTGRVR